MNEKDTQQFTENFRKEDLYALEENKAALLTMYTGIGAILSLLLTFFIGSFSERGRRTEISIVFMLLLVVVSVILYFVLSKKDERWYLVCSLLNHGGIGLAALTLTDVLGIDVRFLNLAVSGLPAAAILFGVVMILVSQNGANADGWLSAGIFALLVMCGIALYRFIKLEQTEFWLSMAVCTLLSSVNLGVLIWSRRDVWQNSIYKGLAAGSFGVYLILLVAVIIAFIVMVARSDHSDRKSDRDSRDKPGGTTRGFTRGFSGRSRLGGVGDNGFDTGNARSATVYDPSRQWYYSPHIRYHFYNINQMNDMDDAIIEPTSFRCRLRKVIITLLIIAVVVLLILLAIKAGRG